MGSGHGVYGLGFRAEELGYFFKPDANTAEDKCLVPEEGHAMARPVGPAHSLYEVTIESTLENTLGTHYI